MNARVPQNSLTFVVPNAFSPSGTSDFAAPQHRRGFLGRVAAVAQWVAEMPRRRAVLEELSALSDHELSDIGLVRSDLSHVFEASFIEQRRAA